MNVSKFLAYILCFLRFLIVNGDEHNHRYEDKEEVVLWVSNVGPFDNLQETYLYYTLPFCQGPKESINHYHETFGEALQGIELESSGITIEFKSGVPKAAYCEVELNDDKLERFSYAIKNNYWYLMYLDDLPIWAPVGELEGGSIFIFTHKKIEIGFNKNQIVEVDLTPENKVKLEKGTVLSFTYEVIWKSSRTKFAERFDRYLDADFFQHRVHWFSIFNSFMMVLVLVALVFVILVKTLKKDLARYCRLQEDGMEQDFGNEYGWKQVHGDVFRPAPCPVLLSTLVGNGCQIGVVILCVVVSAILWQLYLRRGSLVTTSIFVYAVTAPVNGYYGGSLYAQLGGKKWIQQMIISGILVPSILYLVEIILNSIAVYYHASKAIPLSSVVLLFGIFFLIILPLNLVGTILGRNTTSQLDFPCRVNSVPRSIPGKKWFLRPAVIALLGGILPFGSIFIEIYFIFSSFWAYKIYYVYGFMLLVMVILISVTTCTAIVSTYFLLNSEDYRWQWTSFFSAASTAAYVFLYAIYYFIFKTRMHGLFQTAFYFGYMGLLCLGLGILCGTAGYMGSSFFVYKIYSSIKID